MPNQTSSGWKHDDRGRAYWQDEAGRHIHVRPDEFKHNSKDIPGVSSTNPSVVAGHYKPSNEGPKKANSWPSRSQPSYLSEKLAGRNKPYFGDGASQQSGRPDVDTPARPHDVLGVTRPNASTDVYRDAKKDWGPAGPAGSAYDSQHAEYKQRGVEQARAAHEYTALPKRGMPTGADIQRNRDTLGGFPIQTQQWHQEAAQKAALAAQAAAG
ncbi:hypothetical protein PG996_013819 [Apiospora saccharicola]|uniref:DUF4124 domain-containing protein n=1 Tax=Apiospora saccharicola TaxID=335842 RepID=A0ABR1TIH5_9PEZI